MRYTPRYFNRDISWLSFNHRVLEEAKSKNNPLFERLKFLAIYSSNLDEFYKVRVAEYKYDVDYDELDDPNSDSPVKVVREINRIVREQLEEFSRIFHEEILTEMRKEGIILYQGNMPPDPEHQQFIREYFYREVIPYLQPILLTKGTRSFLRDNRLYLAIRLYRKKRGADNGSNRRPRYALVKLPYTDVKRFIRLPDKDGCYHFLFLEDLVRFNLQELFPGYDIDSSYCVKLLRDADLGIKDEFSGNLVEKIRKNLGRRKVGEPALFTYDRSIPEDFLAFLQDVIGVYKEDLLAGERYLNFQDFFSFPNPFAPRLQLNHPQPIHPYELEQIGSMFAAIREKDRILHYPYQSFDYLIKFLNEAAQDPKVYAIKVTQYRVASNSAVVNSLISAARNGKQVSVFVEVKARFDEENNLTLARLMSEAGVRIIYSLPGLKVHAKLALVLRRSGNERKRSFAYLSTGNFNEKTARQYADHGFFTCKEDIIRDLENLFSYFENPKFRPEFTKLWVTRFNFKNELRRRIDREIELARQGKKGYILVKLNGIQNKPLINLLYKASEAGVKIDMIIRGICCLVPNQKFSRNINLRRIVDSYLEHGRIIVFGNDGAPEVYLTSADWMNRNINRRIETTFPVEDEDIKKELFDILDLQLRDNVSARLINENLENIPIVADGMEPIRAQWDTYKMLIEKETRFQNNNL
ncbi:polyphosphate kinase 1 [Xiashengella succiniciproducens]|jgi:polyphosphate kinase|uniref:Polyphosphate kinase n=1 Tax=Xiashengella succiniciproducens TaxID=2949635 RepID=A0A9J6ZNE6_9BACT|nr:polyphosphate kinase 1 [Alkaliflexus sp. Ai-910]URW79237.1 polyphosphate kinase 1 [Alkaliflexus sp. Ai-910]